MGKSKIVVILGPTASGKSALAVELALKFNGEVINADSMQVYRYMDIGTAKPSVGERQRVPHHLIDIVDPDEDYTAADFKRDAEEKIAEITSKGKNVFIAGGTGLYIRALTQGLFEGPGADKRLRDELKSEAQAHGKEALYERLKRVDPASAAAIHPNNLVRVIRAIEVYELSKRPISELQKEHGFQASRYDVLKVGLMKEREALYRDIDARVDAMMEAGLLDETKRLMDAGYSIDLKPMCGLGYKEMSGFLMGETALDEAVALIKRNTRRYAKRQMTWFRKEGGVKWFSPVGRNEVMEAVRGFLK